MGKYPLISSFCFTLFFLYASFAAAQMTSTNYIIRSDSLSGGGDDISTSTSYILRDSVNLQGTGDSESSSYAVDGGYREKIFDPVAEFSIFRQDRSSQVAASSLSSNTVSVTSASGFSTGDMIALIQDEGALQISAIGEITTISSNDITVDFFADNGTAPTIDGTNDYVYLLDNSSPSFGTLDSSLVSTSIIGWEVDADIDNGFTVYVYEDQDLMSGSNTIADVADGTVSAGASEYGGRSSDTSLSGSTFDTADTAFTTTIAEISTRTSGNLKQRDFLTLKASVAADQAGGSYSHNLTFLYVGTY